MGLRSSGPGAAAPWPPPTPTLSVRSSPKLGDAGLPEGRRAATPGIQLLASGGRSQDRWGKTCFGSLPGVRPRSPNQTHSSPLGPHSSLRRGTRVGHGGTGTGFGLCHAAWAGPMDPPHLLCAQRRSGSRDDLRRLPCLTPRPRPALPGAPGPGPGRGRRCFASGSRASAQRKASLL